MTSDDCAYDTAEMSVRTHVLGCRVEVEPSFVTD